jgi:hypothetical protein
MPSWGNEPPTEDANGSIRLIRTPATGTLRAVILSDDLIGTPTHYDGTRTRPCEKMKCELCTKGLPWRWHGYIAVWIVGTQERAILELTAAASQRIVDHRKITGSLRGLDISCTRPKGKANSRVAVALGAVQRPSRTLPPCPDVKAVMSYIWGYDPEGVHAVRNIIGRNEFTLPPPKAGGNGHALPTGDGIGKLPPE